MQGFRNFAGITKVTTKIAQKYLSTQAFMNLSSLTAISPVDGRYHSATASLADWFSEFALIRYRVRVEVEYFIALCQWPLPQLAEVPTASFEEMRNIYRNFSEADAHSIKTIEKTTNHDVKAV